MSDRILHVIIVDQAEFIDETGLLSNGAQVFLVEALAECQTEIVVRRGVELRCVEVLREFLDGGDAEEGMHFREDLP